MDGREFRGMELAAKARIEQRRTYWYVPSATHDGGYKVNNEGTECTCPDYEERQLFCKHCFAVQFVRERNRTIGTPAIKADPADAPGPRPTYRQNWPQYNKSQTTEKEVFLKLLADLCGHIEWMPRGGRGRPTLPYDDAILAAVFKVYSTFSGRRFQTDLRDAQDAGHIAVAPSFASVFRVLEDPNTTKTLKELVIRSSLPLRVIETKFAADSTGFSTSKFARWFDTKWGVEKKKAEWVKCHAMVGVKTNIVCACEISDAHDSTQFPQLLATTGANFRMDEVSADKGYLSFENMQLTEEAGAVPFISFKVNSRAENGPSIWQRMHAMFTLRREDWLRKYHLRSNVESVFSAIKRKFGDAVRSRTDVACKNEVLAKIVAHNVVTCIHESNELGIELPFTRNSESRGISESDRPFLERS
jgi:transposase